MIHYYVVSSDFVSKSDIHFEVGSWEETSHMLLNISIKSKQSEPEKRVERTKRESVTNIKWDQGKAEEFQEAINSEASKESIQGAVYLLY